MARGTEAGVAEARVKRSTFALRANEYIVVCERDSNLPSIGVSDARKISSVAPRRVCG